MQALVPMVDLFAVLAIVFMIHSNEEITVAQTEVQEARNALEAFDEAEQARRERRELLANTASKSLEEIRAGREREAQELLTQFTEMLAAQQSSADTEYENILARIENEHEEELQREVISLEQQTQAELEQARVDASARQAALDEQRQLEVARAEQELQAQAEREAREAELALARAEQERADALATQAAALDEQRRLEVARAEQELQAQAEREAEALRREADLALARAEEERQSDLAAQRTALEEERARALADAADELAPYLQAVEAKNQIVEELNENFGDFDNSAVEIDPETGKVKLHFQESYFALGSHELSEEMKSFLRVMIPRYAQSIYGNRDAAEQVESLNISGMASPIYQGVYIDIFDTSRETQQAREYNMALSNRRAEALYSFIFDADEMGDYAFPSLPT